VKFTKYRFTLKFLFYSLFFLCMVKNNDLRICLIGAGSVSFGLSMLGDLMTEGYEPLAGSTIVLHDINEDALRRTSGVLKKAMQEAAEGGDKVPYKVETTTNPKTALQGANYVIMSIEHGNRVDAWKQDYYVPIKHGSTQVYGENGGPGGAFHTWRQVPPMIKICREMEDYCPDAWLFNFSNPLPRVTWALNKASKIKKIGLCHGILAGTIGLSAILNTQLPDLDFISAGLNHFYWFTKVNAKKDLTLPAFGPHPETKISAGTSLLNEVKERGITWAQQRELTLIEELFRVYGHLTYPSESHPGEYIPWANYYAKSVKYNFVEFAKFGDDMKAKLDATLRGENDNFWWVHFSNERAIPIIVGMENNTGHLERAINLQNDGAISNMPNDCIVEVPCTVDKHGFHRQNVGNMPKGIAQLLNHEVQIQSLVADAAVTGDVNTAIQALSIDGTIPSPQVARNIFNEMFSLQKQYLPQFSKSK
jgi:alpha-galactosidase